MKYEKQTFVNGQVLTAECLNRMENGIKGACDAVPPACDSADCSKVLSYGANGYEWVSMPSGGDALTVTVTDDAASHTAAEIYAHAQTGDVVLMREDALWTLGSCTQTCAIFTSNIPEEGVFYSTNIYEDGSWEHFQFACPTEYQINSLIDEKLGVIENGSY